MINSHRKYVLSLFWWSAKKRGKNKQMALWFFFVIATLYGAGNSKCSSSYSFIWSQPNLLRIQVVTLLSNPPSLKKDMSLWNFTMAVNWKILKCYISGKTLIITGENVGFGVLWSTYVGYIHVWLFEFSLESNWNQTISHQKLGNFPALRSSKGYSPYRSHPKPQLNK